MPVAALGRDAWVSTAEDTVIQKLRWGRPKDLDDAVGTIAVSGSGLDWAYVQCWTDSHGTSGTSDELVARVAGSDNVL